MAVSEKGPAYSILNAVVNIVSGSTIVPIDLFYVREVQPNPQVTTLTFEGDDTSQQVDLMARAEVQVSCDKLDLDAETAIFGKPKYTNLVSGEVWSAYFGDQAEQAGVAAQLIYDVAFKDESVVPNVATVIRYTWLNGLCKLIRPQNATYQAKFPTVLNFVFYRTTTDILGNPIPSGTAGGQYYRVGRLS